MAELWRMDSSLSVVAVRLVATLRTCLLDPSLALVTGTLFVGRTEPKSPAAKRCWDQTPDQCCALQMDSSTIEREMSRLGVTVSCPWVAWTVGRGWLTYAVVAIGSAEMMRMTVFETGSQPLHSEGLARVKSGTGTPEPAFAEVAAHSHQTQLQ